MDPPAMDPAAIAVADYEEDPDENFTGPNDIANFFAEDEDEDYYDDGSAYADPLERSAAQRANPQEMAQAGIVSDYIQLGAVPGSTTAGGASWRREH